MCAGALADRGDDARFLPSEALPLTLRLGGPSQLFLAVFCKVVAAAAVGGSIPSRANDSLTVRGIRRLSPGAISMAKPESHLRSTAASKSLLHSRHEECRECAMSKTRKMRLVAFLKTGPTAHHHGMWRHPETDNDFLDPAWYEHVARVLEKGKFDCLFFADTLGLFDNYRGTFDAILRGGGQMGFLDPLPVLAVMSRVTQHIGLGATMSTTFHNPYQIARTLGTLDVLSGGRMAWNVVSSISNLEARNFGYDELPPRNLRYDRADEVMEACFRLWESWEPDALIVDKESGVFADPSKVHYVDYVGKWIKTRGPLTVPRSPQGHPVIMQAGSSDRGREFAARWAEVIFTIQRGKEEMAEFYTDIKTGMLA